MSDAVSAAFEAYFTLKARRHYNGCRKQRIKRSRCVALVYPLFSKSAVVLFAPNVKCTPAFSVGCTARHDMLELT